MLTFFTGEAKVCEYLVQCTSVACCEVGCWGAVRYLFVRIDFFQSAIAGVIADSIDLLAIFEEQSLLAYLVEQRVKSCQEIHQPSFRQLRRQ